MSDLQSQSNPLRPYILPRAAHPDALFTSNASATTSKPASTSSFALPDLDYSDYIPDASPSIAGTVRTVLDKALWRYTSVLTAQPFEVAKLILQVRIAQEDDGEANMPQTPNAKYRNLYEEADSDDDEPNYFSSSAPFIQSPTGSNPPRGRTGRPQPEKRPSQRKAESTSSETLQLKNAHSLLDALSALSAIDGPLAVWRGTNSTFIYHILHRTLETFLRSFMAALIGMAETDVLLSTSSTLPDPQILNAATPAATLLIATLSAALSAMLLSPIDTARTRLILSTSSYGPRSLLGALKTLSPSWLIPSHLVPITFLTSSLPTLVSTSTPLFLKQYLQLDPVINPTSWSIFTFLGSAIDLSIKFPLETVLRRAQIATWTSPELSSTRSRSSRRQKEFKPIETIVPVPTTYRGVVPTMWGIMRDEGYSESQKDRTAALMGKAPRRKRKGQGVEGLYRGWRVGLWGLVGIWGTSFVGGLQGRVEDVSPGNVHGGKF